MCLQRLHDLTDNLGNRLESVDFINNDKDTCDYIEVTNNDSWPCEVNDLVVFQLNIPGLLNKQGDLQKLINRAAGKNKIDIVLLQETWLTNSNCHLVCIPGYKHIYNHRTGRNGGGVSILISNELTSRRCDDLCLNEATLECCCAEIKLPKQKLLVSSIYHPPNISAPSFNIKFEKLFPQMMKKQSSCIIGSDHNLDLIKSQQHRPTQDFLENVLHHGLIPCVTCVMV